MVPSVLIAEQKETPIETLWRYFEFPNNKGNPSYICPIDYRSKIHGKICFISYPWSNIINKYKFILIDGSCIISVQLSKNYIK